MLDRIPYEIFREIIKLAYAHESSITPPPDDFDEIGPPPIKVTHVCRAWRTALLSDPAMWTGIELRVGRIYLNELKEILSRSGSLPLDVLIESSNLWLHRDLLQDELCPVISVISREMHRCRQLQMIISESLLPLFSSCLDHSLPMLHKFYFEVFGGDELKRRLTLRLIHQTLFSGDAPNLTHIHLPIPASMEDLRLSLFKNLSSLHLQFEYDTVFNGDILLAIFQSSPHLRILDIVWSCLGPEITSSLPPSYRIPLPRLRYLSFRGSYGIDVANFILGRLDFAMENINFNIRCDDIHSRTSDSVPLLYFLSQQHFTTLSIFLGTFDLIVEFFKRIDQGTPSTSFLDGNSVFKTIYDDSYMTLDHLPNFLRPFNLSDITYLRLGGISLKSVILRSIFHSLGNLRHLCVRHGSWEDPPQPGSTPPRSPLKALMPQSHHSKNPRTQSDSESEADDNAGPELTNISENGQEHSFPCPLLRTLELVLLYDPAPSRLDEAYLQVLVECSRIRKQSGCPFNLIVNCYGSLDFAKDMEAWLQAHEDAVAAEVRLII